LAIKYGKHGHIKGNTYSTEYMIWRAIKIRCHNAKHPTFAGYGGRGISMCDQWRNSFLQFYTDVGPRPNGHSIDRIDNDGNYEPGNVRWATFSEQQRNRRVCHYVFYNEERVNLMTLCERLAVNYRVAVRRIKMGWPLEDALWTEKGKWHPSKSILATCQSKT